MSVDSLTLTHDPTVPHVLFGIFNLAWPNIAFWLVGIVIFAIGVYARIPESMEMDAEDRHRCHAQTDKEDSA
jgi:hypothetical protein